MVRRVLIAGVASLATLALLLCLAAAWLLYTGDGLRWSLARIADATQGALSVDEARGTWAHGVTAQRLAYGAADVAITAQDVRIVLSPWSVLQLAPRVDTLEAARLTVALADSGRNEPRAVPASLALPVDIDLRAARVGTLVIEQPAARHELHDVALRYAGGRTQHLLRYLEARHALGHARVEGSIAAERPYAIKGRITLELEPPVAAQIEAKLDGTLSELHVMADAQRGGARANADVLATPFAPLPLEHAHLRWSGVDAHEFEPALPHTRIAGEARLRLENGRWTGPLSAVNALAGPWDRQRLPLSALSAQLALAPPQATLDQLRVELGRAGVVSGTAHLTPRSARLDLAASALDLRGLQTRLRQTRLKGRVEIALAPDTQTASGVLQQDDVRLAFEAKRAGDDVRLPRFTASSRGSELRGNARLSLAGKRPYEVSATLDTFDPSAWGDFPVGSLNGRVKLAGALETQEIRAQYALQRSTLIGAALEGDGRLTYAPQRISDVDLRLALGGNRVAARGAFGAIRDTLSLRIDAPRLAALDRGVSGAISGTAVLSGTWRSPRAELHLRGQRLGYGKDARVDSAELAGSVRQGDPPSADVTLRATGVTTKAWHAGRIAVAVRGTETAHTLSAQARGGDVDLVLAARGGWHGEQGWSGVVSQLANAGKIPFELASPVEVEARAHYVRLGPFEARLMGGSIALTRLRYDGGAVDTAGRLIDFPVRPLLALAGMPTGPHDTLRIAGDWDVASAPELKARLFLQRASGDLVLGQDRPLPLGLTALRLDGRLAGERLRFDGVVRSALVSADASGSIGATGGAARFGAASPLDVAIEAQVARLAVFAGLFETTTAYFDGRAQAKLQVRGTVGSPALNGTLSGDRLAVALPPQGIDLSEGILRARLEDRRVHIDQLAFRGGEGTLTARGTLALAAGDRASLDWKAERLRILGRPDRRLVVSGDGTASLAGGRLGLTGRLRANDGLFQIGESDLPSLGPDVVVLGRAQPAPPESPLASRAALDITLDFGSDLHILGRGLDAWIEGRVTVRSGAGGQLDASGTVSTQRGSYTAFGQKLQIDRGRLIFSGPLENPGLDIVAMRKNQAVEAGVAVTGTAKSPLVRIVSYPPVPEGEALSWLVLGHGPADASRADLAALPLAAAALFGQGKASQGSLAQSLGIDTLSLRGSTTLANNVVAVGKRFSNNLYVIYEQSLGGLANVLKVEFNLTRRVLLTAETGAISAAGVLFRWAFD